MAPPIKPQRKNVEILPIRQPRSGGAIALIPPVRPPALFAPTNHPAPQTPSHAHTTAGAHVATVDGFPLGSLLFFL